MTEDGAMPAPPAAEAAADTRPVPPYLPDAPPTEADVVAAYHMLLGRAPESRRVIGAHAAKAGTVETLRRRFLASIEFAEMHGINTGPGIAKAAMGAIELDATPAQVAGFLAAAQRQWETLGELAPHWSAQAEPMFHPDRIASSRRTLFATGREDREILQAVLAQQGIPLEGLGRLVDFGCGIGRATLHLAALVPEVTGVDFARSQLAIARNEARARGLDHIAWLATPPGETMPHGGCGLWFSRRVLQHNTPPVIRALLARTFEALPPGAAAVFQLLTWGQDYGFAVEPALAETAAAPGFQLPLHVLPQREVFALAAAAGLDVLGVHDDPVPGVDRRRWLSHLFVLRRPD